MTHFSIAIDGPAGAGKSTIAKQLASKLSCIYIDTGAMYRTVGYYCITQDIDYTNEQAVCEVLPQINIDLTYKNMTQTITLNGVDVSEVIRNQEVATAASKVATYEKVRSYLVERQRELAGTTSVVMDGRDIGTVVLPNATLKIYLTADATARAKRRLAEYESKGMKGDYDTLLEEIVARDYQDMNRSVSPLKQAVDAVVVDTTHMSIEEVVVEIYSKIKNK